MPVYLGWFLHTSVCVHVCMRVGIFVRVYIRGSECVPVVSLAYIQQACETG